MANDTLAFLKATNLSKVYLLRFSLGGFISQRIMSDAS
jgi:pimeloyl-ACP methyl ester carboxylesterase